MFSLFSTDVYVIFLYWNILMKCTHFIFICHWLMLTFLFVENILQFQYCFWLFTDVDYFSCAKCSYHSWLMFMWFSVTETYQWSGWTSSSFVTYWCWHFVCGKYSMILILLLIIYWCWHIFHVQNVLIILDWCLCDFLLLKHIDEVDGLHYHFLFTDVDIFLCQICSGISILFLIIYWCWLFFICKMLLWFLTDVYWIFLYWNIFMKCTHFVFSCHWLMLIFFCGKYSRISIVMLSIFLSRMFLSFSTDVYVIFLYWTCEWSVCISSSLVIYWCWHIFVL